MTAVVAREPVARHRAALAAVLARGAMTLDEVWLDYFALGGNADPVELEGYLEGALSLSCGERDVISQAVNERLEDLAGRLRLPMARPLRESLPANGPLKALVHLLQTAPEAMSGRLATAAAAAGRALGAENLVIYLVDYAQHLLVPVPADGESREPLDVERTLPGRAFQTGAIQVVTDPPRLWVPLVDGVQRLGVVDVMLPSELELADPHLAEQAGWLASLLAHLIAATAEHGDEIDAVRRSRPRTPAAELVWALLPPLCAGSEEFTLAGMLEPVHEVGGDAFDYALGEDRVDVAVFDAMGHSLGAGLIVATALSAYRAARRARRSLYAQAAAVDEAVSGQFYDAFATGVLAELELRTGRLRYVAAGHPPPLLLRGGKVVAALDDGRRPPFGLGTGELVVGEASLQRGDWLVLYTDGITEARDPDGRFFGVHRLVDFLERQAAAEQPPAETVRRLIHAVLRHHKGALQDDATVLLARWTPPHDAPPGPAAAPAAR